MAVEKKEQKQVGFGGLISEMWKKKGEQDAMKEALKNKSTQFGSSSFSGVTSGVDTSNIGSFSGIA